MVNLMLAAVLPLAAAQCDNSVLPELSFRMGGNNLDWPCQATKNIYTNTGRYLPKNVIATRAQIYRDAAFVAMPRYRAGVPFTLGRIELKKGKCSVAISPYPCWASQEEGNCQALQNVVDVFLDRQVGYPLLFQHHAKFANFPFQLFRTFCGYSTLALSTIWHNQSNDAHQKWWQSMYAAEKSLKPLISRAWLWLRHDCNI